jgi:hypothetical protein
MDSDDILGKNSHLKENLMVKKNKRFLSSVSDRPKDSYK